MSSTTAAPEVDAESPSTDLVEFFRGRNDRSFFRRPKDRSPKRTRSTARRGDPRVEAFLRDNPDAGGISKGILAGVGVTGLGALAIAGAIAAAPVAIAAGTIAGVAVAVPVFWGCREDEFQKATAALAFIVAASVFGGSRFYCDSAFEPLRVGIEGTVDQANVATTAVVIGSDGNRVRVELPQSEDSPVVKVRRVRDKQSGRGCAEVSVEGQPIASLATNTPTYPKWLPVTPTVTERVTGVVESGEPCPTFDHQVESTQVFTGLGR